MSKVTTLIKTHIKNSEYKYNPSKSLSWNEQHLKHMAFLENSCEVLYNKLESTFGETYAEYILTRVLKKEFTITQFEKYPLKEYPNISKRILMGPFLNKGSVKNDMGNTLITYYTAVVREIISAMKKSASIEMYDFFICLGLMMEKWRITEYPKYITKRLDDVELLLKQFVKHVIYALYAKEGEIQNITLAILDKRCFEECLKQGDYSVEISRETGERLTATYDMYMNALKVYFDLIQGTKNSQEYIQPAIRTYAFASNKLRAEFLELIAKDTGIHIGVLQDIFKHVQFDALPQCIDSPEYLEAFSKVEELYTKKHTNFMQLKAKLKALFSTDYINYLNIVNRELGYFLTERELEKNVVSYETIYLKKFWDTFEPRQKGVFSEVTIDYAFIANNCQSQEEYKNRLYKAVIDAQAINQMRASLIYNTKRKPEFTLNVKLDGCEEDMISYSYSIMSEATDYLKYTYQLPFTFEISQRVFFRDKSRRCYLIL